MKHPLTISVIISCLLFASCAENTEHLYFGPLTILGSDFETVKSPKYVHVVESSLVQQSGKTIYLPSFKPGNVSIDSGDSSYKSVQSDAYYSYIFEHNGLYYELYNIGAYHGDIYLRKSNDLIHWQQMNNGLAVLSEQQGTDYQIIWNPGAAIDDHGVWHLLVECGQIYDNQQDVGLCYQTASLTGDLIDFNLDKKGKVIAGGGQPWLQYVDGKGIMAVYGKLHAPNNDFGDEWYITGAILDGITWKESTQFFIGAKGIHVADPHITETSQGLDMFLSYNQYSVYELRSEKTSSDLYDLLEL